MIVLLQFRHGVLQGCLDSSRPACDNFPVPFSLYMVNTHLPPKLTTTVSWVFSVYFGHAYIYVVHDEAGAARLPLQ